MTLTHRLDVVSSDRETYTLPAGTPVTVHHFSGSRCAVAVDGRVYRCTETLVAAALN